MPGIVDFEDKVAVVTGGASGIGFAMAQRFLADGAKVVVADIEQAALDRAVSDLDPSGERVLGIRTDVSSTDSLQHLADRTAEAFGGVDILCNNAGVETGGRIADVNEQAWRWVMDVNFFGILNGCRIFLPMLEQRPGAHIVNTASVAAFASGTPTMAPYCASKFAVLGFSESLEIELRSGGSTVGVSVLAPGPVKTRMTEAERNRPDSVTVSTDPERQQVIADLARKTAASGMDPADVAVMVSEAIQRNRFFVLTHPEIATQGVKTRLAWMETGQPPAPRTAGT
jgi:NAD(P)-dependent dehydrogenase (short-subunit alcohol dehydrogenase family)